MARPTNESTTPVTTALRRSPPALHGEREFWGIAWEALEWLERNVTDGMRTLETGAGASTIVFAARGTRHEAVTPDPAEEERIRRACRERGIDDSRLTFHIGPSENILPGLPPGELDLVLVDGAHGFPYPVLDWWHLAPRLKAGGRMLLDDANLPAVSAIVEYARASDAWVCEKPVSFRTACIRKLSDEAPPAQADSLAARGKMSFAYLPMGRRVVASVRTRVFSTRLGLWVVRTLRRPE
jgi:Methyltransferase domain